MVAAGVGAAGGGVGVPEGVGEAGRGVQEGSGVTVVGTGVGAGRDVGDAVGATLGTKVGLGVCVGTGGRGLGELLGTRECVIVSLAVGNEDGTVVAAGGTLGEAGTGLPGAWQPHTNSPINSSPTEIATRLSEPNTDSSPPQVRRSPRGPANPAARSRRTVSELTSA